jgi:flagellar biosynthetic protein FliP
MAGAMVVPLGLLAPMLWVGVISGEALLTLQHVLMLPAMLGAMLVRRSEYGL